MAALCRAAATLERCKLGNLRMAGPYRSSGREATDGRQRIQILDSLPRPANHLLYAIMNSTSWKLLGTALATAAASLTHAMEIQWTRMAGQWPVEASPLVGHFTNPNEPQILVVNRGGQVLLWPADGKAIGDGQDGIVCQLPTNRWTTVPTRVDGDSGTRLMVASVEGLVVGLDERFRLLWQYKLPGEAGWGRAMPAVLRSGYVFADSSGTATCLNGKGEVVWTNHFGLGPCKAPPGSSSAPDQEAVLVAAGSMLVCCNLDGSIRWRRELDQEILTRPEVLSHEGSPLILCGTASGALFAVNPKGEIVWRCDTGDTFSNWIRLLPRGEQESPLIVFTGLWGNLHAVDVQGRPVWTHLFRAKTRAEPAIVDTDLDGRHDIYVPTFHQRVYAFDQNGSLKDDIRLSGIMPSSLTGIRDDTAKRYDLLATTTTLLSYRLRAGAPKSTYGPTPQPKDLVLRRLPADEPVGTGALLVENPRGGLVNVQLALTNAQGWPRILGTLSARSAFEIPLPALVSTGNWQIVATARDASGTLLATTRWEVPEQNQAATASAPPNDLHAWGTPPFADFDETRPRPSAREVRAGETNRVSVESLYVDEADQGAFVIASSRAEPTRMRVKLGRFTREDGTNFGGSCVLREVVCTGSVNGERVPDALPALGDAGLITLPAHRAAKVWLSVDARGAQPGNYTGSVTIAELELATNRLELPVMMEVVNLRLPREFPLTLCTWDYVPNRWFPSRSREVLDDMARHGVNVFPRTILPPARVDAAGKLTMDWPVLDAELDRLNGRGRILFHLNHPPIEFATPKTDAEKRPLELAYIRALRDHLRERGRGYEDYAFYLLDEPGLDNGLNLHVLLDAGQLFREADPKLLTYTDPVPGLSWKDYERIEPLVDVWAPNMRLVSGLLSGDPRIARIMKQKTVWSYECVSQVKSLSPLRYNRANAWRAKFFGLSGIGFWTHSTTEVDHWLPGKTINDEYALVYPGELPVPSVRWEAVRDGLEDVAAMALLDERIQHHWDAGTKNEVVREAERALQLALRDVMELSNEAFVESRDFLRAGDRVIGHTWTDQAAFRRHRKTIADFTLELDSQ